MKVVGAYHNGTAISRIYHLGQLLYEAGGPPVNTGAPALSGPGFVNFPITCSTGSWIGAVAYEYQHMNGGVDVAGETAASRIPEPGDDTAVMGCKVRAQSASGHWSDWVSTSNTLIGLQMAAILHAPATGGIAETDGSVNLFIDLSGNGNDFPQALGSATPKSNTRTINGLRVLELDGSNDNMIGPAALYNIANDDNTVYAVAEIDDTGFAFLFGGNLSGANVYSMRFQSGSSGGPRVVHGGSSTTTVTAAAGTGPNILLSNRDGANITVSTGGAAAVATATTASSTPLDALRLGANGSGGSTFDGTIGTFLMARRSHSTAEMNQVGQWLNSIYAAPWSNFS